MVRVRNDERISLTFARKTNKGSTQLEAPIMLTEILRAVRNKALAIDERQVVNFIKPKELGVYTFEVRNCKIKEIVVWVVKD